MDVTFYSGGCTLAGTFTAAAEPVAAALLITGSGRTSRDSDARLPGGLMPGSGWTGPSPERSFGSGQAETGAGAPTRLSSGVATIP